MTKESIQNTLLHNRRPIAIHAIWARFEKYRAEIKTKDREIKALEEKLGKKDTQNESEQK